MLEKLIPLNILIGDRTYRIKSDPNDEEVIRKTLKLINDKIIEFKTNFSGKDMQDYIAMVLIWYATQTGESVSENGSEDKMHELLTKLEQVIDKAN